MAQKPKKPPKAKNKKTGILYPEGYTEPVEPEEPSKGALNQKRSDIKDAIEAIVQAATEPLLYDDIYYQLRADNVDLKWLRHEVHYLISEVDEALNPDDFVVEEE